MISLAARRHPGLAMRPALFLFALLMPLVLLAGCRQQGEWLTLEGVALGTGYHITLNGDLGEGEPALVEAAIQGELAGLEAESESLQRLLRAGRPALVDTSAMEKGLEAIIQAHRARAVDRLAGLLGEFGVAHALIELGGAQRALGMRVATPGGSGCPAPAWRPRTPPCDSRMPPWRAAAPPGRRVAATRRRTAWPWSCWPLPWRPPWNSPLASLSSRHGASHFISAPASSPCSSAERGERHDHLDNRFCLHAADHGRHGRRRDSRPQAHRRLLRRPQPPRPQGGLRGVRRQGRGVRGGEPQARQPAPPQRREPRRRPGLRRDSPLGTFQGNKETRGSMAVHNYDVVVIGTGPAGESAAINAAKNGKRVAVVEKQPLVGGNCTHWGTIPSKALRHQVKQIMQFNTNRMFRDIGEPRWFSFPRVMERSRATIDQQVVMRTNFYARNRIDLFSGVARFKDEHAVLVRDEHEGMDELVAEKIIIATGSRPYRPADINFRHPRIYCSDTILSLNHTPRTLIIFGAGVIGCEYASIFSGLGVKVDLINNRDSLLSFLDDEISDALSYHLRKHGVLIRHNEEYDRVEGDESGVTVHLKSGKRLRAAAGLWAHGRPGTTRRRGRENIGPEANCRGRLTVGEPSPTGTPPFRAGGAVVGWPG